VRIDDRFRELYEAEFAPVYRAALALSGDPGLAEDATQEAFARALERWRRLRDVPWVAGWVTTTALNVVRRSLRRRPAPETGTTPGGPDVEGSVDLWRAVGGLPPRQQEAVLLHYVVDLPLADVASAMGCEEGTVKAHLAKARAKLAATLGGDRVDG
jgi:RNA polymerase sigma-70 factor (ECF subfamily)